MSTNTYYIVQVDSTRFIHKSRDQRICLGYGWKYAAHLTLAEAHRIYRNHKAQRNADTPRRFPRIIKVTVETKTITPNN